MYELNIWVSDASNLVLVQVFNSVELKATKGALFSQIPFLQHFKQRVLSSLSSYPLLEAHSKGYGYTISNGQHLRKQHQPNVHFPSSHFGRAPWR
jgi:hypothetical protein